jgi:hypothetical protein
MTLGYIDIFKHKNNRRTSRVEDRRGSIKPRFPSPLIKPDMRSYRIRLSDWLLLKAHAGRQVLSALAALLQVLRTLVPKDTDGCLANAPYAVQPENV